ncbi:DeoR/GlpR transcriptional regulator [Bacillaceae bacterium SIJ1]|uniref:DeoR/GlpR family DNA-binding transcription regulator n=1 Tax=Litoribacterium kuwaitense TaxID=1398745 RepID=UPI0013EA3281|nr:DeoR/GlpR family DNA-binding transcription regulator [Litoribacterium kuwaitense]NGP43813.1 DeoR/GlpR transcriptional regulator [Litoribacterium kuwaitense]
MLPEERLETIKNLLVDKKSINTSSLTEMLNVSSVTIRKDLDKLQEEGFLKKTFGGAILSRGPEENEEETLSQVYSTKIENADIKKSIAELALTQIDKGDTIFLGSGATCYFLAKKLKELSQITVVTNNINALYELVACNTKVFFIGGEIVYNEGMISTSSEKVDEYFKGIFVNKAFTSVTGVDLTAGLTVNHMISAYIYKKIQEMSSEWVLMVEKEKFNKRGIHQVARADSPNCMISNEIPPEYITYYNDRNITMISNDED